MGDVADLAALTEKVEAAIDRAHFLGGSDAAAVMGLSPWSTPVELWQQKTGRRLKQAPDAAALRRFARGHKLEPFIRDMAVEKLREMGLSVELVDSNKRYRDCEHGFLSCEIDFELRLTGSIEIGGEVHTFHNELINCDAKSVTGFARKKWGDVDTQDVPIEYAAQFMHGLMVTGRRYCLVAALRSFDDVDVFWTVRDDETIAGMRLKLVSFWLDCVLGDTPPDPMVYDDIKALFPVDNGDPIEATQEVAMAVGRLTDVDAQIKRLEEQKKALQFEITDFISPHSILTFGGQEIASWKAQPATRLDQRALKEAVPSVAAMFTTNSTTRVLRIKKGASK